MHVLANSNKIGQAVLALSLGPKLHTSIQGICQLMPYFVLGVARKPDVSMTGFLLPLLRHLI